MTKFGLAALFALTSTSALAGSVVEIPINGGVARIHVSDKCRDALCASVSWQERGGERREFNLPAISSKTISKLLDGQGVKWNSSADDDDAEEAPAIKREPVRPAPQRQPASKKSSAPTAAVPAPAPAPAPSARDDELAGGPGDRYAPAARLAPEPVESARIPDPAPSASRPAPSSQPEPKVAAVAPAPSPKSTRPSPIGEWMVEDGEGRVRIEECGANLCGYVSAAKNPNEKDRRNPDPALRGRSVIGAPVLIDMKPAGNRWSGSIYNVKDGKTYTANMSLKGADALRVEGCAFGGMICGGQSWSRAN